MLINNSYMQMLERLKRNRSLNALHSCLRGILKLPITRQDHLEVERISIVNLRMMLNRNQKTNFQHRNINAQLQFVIRIEQLIA